MKLTAHHNLVRRLGMRGAVPVCSLYAFMACAGTTLPLTVMHKFDSNYTQKYM